MPRLTDRRLTDLLDAFSSSDPTPGGGSASALAASIGASLLMMVAAMPKTRTNGEAERESLAAAVEELRSARDGLVDLIDRDSDAYDAVLAAYRLPKSTDEEQEARRARIQAVLSRATEVPLEVMRIAARAAARGVSVARDGHRAAVSDIGVALALLSAGSHGAALNVKINLDGLRDRMHADTMATEARSLESAIAKDVDTARALLGG